jgi:MFS family permease
VHGGDADLRDRGVGALFFGPLSTWWGRAPTLWWSAVISLFFNLAVAFTTDWQPYYILRVVAGIFANAAPSIAIGLLKDMFFFHERARKIGIWTCLFIASPYFGPLFAYFMLADLGHWKPTLWLNFAMQALYVVLLFVFLDETWYNRRVPHQSQPSRGTGFTSRILRLIGYWQIKNHTYFMTLRHSISRFAEALFKPVLLVVYFN